MKLKNKVATDYKVFSKSVNALFTYRKMKMSDAVKDFQSNVIKLTAFHLSNMQQINYQNYVAMRLDHAIQNEIAAQARVTARRIDPEWEALKSDISLMGKLFAAFIARKAQPPWMPVKLDISKNTKRYNYTAVVDYYLKHLEQLIVAQISVGVKNEESMQDILKRIRSQFQNTNRKSREDRKPKFMQKDDDVNDDYDDESWEQTAKIFGKPPVEVSEGVYTYEDIANLQDSQKSAMDWYYRDYNPDMDEAVWERNKAMMGLERDMMNDTLYALHNGFMDVGSENMGIKDFVWKVSFPQKECDVCTDRDGMTMTQIEDKWGKGGFSRGDAWPDSLRQNDPPPLHPHCRCQLVADIKDDWADSALKKEGYEWDPDSGIAFNPDEQQKELGFTKMSWDQWLGDLRGDDGSQNAAFR